MAEKKIVKKKKTVSSKAKKTLLETVDIHYIKTNNYRTYHVDGIFGGLTPDAKKIYIELFVQRSVTPKRIQYEVKGNRIGKEIGSREGLDGLVREIESGIVMDVEVAKVLRDWLDKNIEISDKKGK